MSAARPTRWELAGGENDYYAATFATMLSEGADVDGEARLADAMCPRGARILDVGAGIGRVGSALQARGHTVVAVEPDPRLAGRSREAHRDLLVLERDVLDVDPVVLARHGAPTQFDLAVLVGNVMVFLAEGTEVAVLARVASLLAAGGRVLVGFHPVDAPATSRDYAPEEFVADAARAGLRVEARFGSYELHPPRAEYAVWLLSGSTTQTFATGR